MLPRISPSGGSAFEFYRNDSTCGHNSFSSFLIYASNVCLANPMDYFDPRRIDAFSVDCHNDAVRIHYDLDRVPNCAGVIEHVELPNTCAEHQSLISAERPSATDDDISVDKNFFNPEWINLPPNFPISPISDDAQSPELHRRVTCQASLVPTVTPTAAPSSTAYPTSNTAVLVTFKVKKQVKTLFVQMWNVCISFLLD
uniref:Uncharacterized protein n=2 Tax=Spumella elongata TaxID=89044 RepID=A0A7S3HC92_9STRA|mmetsp:Transcript_44852/g.78292  ORF Transcript_44852/g.78292 Transcript_44852/m.78292 type:complete len:199 (+) Transcript_44852:510-1106(+)